jgi:hypothetical protein
VPQEDTHWSGDGRTAESTLRDGGAYEAYFSDHGNAVSKFLLACLLLTWKKDMNLGTSIDKLADHALLSNNAPRWWTPVFHLDSCVSQRSPQVSCQLDDCNVRHFTNATPFDPRDSTLRTIIHVCFLG